MLEETSHVATSLFCPTYIQVLHSSTNGILRGDLILTILSFPICKDGINIYLSISVFFNFSYQFLKFFQWTDFTYTAKFVLISWIWCFFSRFHSFFYIKHSWNFLKTVLILSLSLFFYLFILHHY